MKIETILRDAAKPRSEITWYDPDKNQLVVISGETLWTEITITATGEYLGWVPVPMVEAHGKGYVSLRELRAWAQPLPPEGLQRYRAPWR
jgi:hypothetical protein